MALLTYWDLFWTQLPKRKGSEKSFSNDKRTGRRLRIGTFHLIYRRLRGNLITLWKPLEGHCTEKAKSSFPNQRENPNGSGGGGLNVKSRCKIKACGHSSPNGRSGRVLFHDSPNKKFKNPLLCAKHSYMQCAFGCWQHNSTEKLTGFLSSGSLPLWREGGQTINKKIND